MLIYECMERLINTVQALADSLLEVAAFLFNFFEQALQSVLNAIEWLARATWSALLRLVDFLKRLGLGVFRLVFALISVLAFFLPTAILLLLSDTYGIGWWVGVVWAGFITAVILFYRVFWKQAKPKKWRNEPKIQIPIAAHDKVPSDEDSYRVATGQQEAKRSDQSRQKFRMPRGLG